MTKHRQEAMVQSSMRIPRGLLQRIDKLADMKGISRAQTIELALLCYCYMSAEFPEGFDELNLVRRVDWQLALAVFKKAEQMKSAEEKQRREKIRVKK